MSDVLDDLEQSLSPAERRNWQRRRRVMDIQFRIHRLCPWLNGPFLRLVSVFWLNLIDEGVVATCKPRWGALTFSFLNDGFRPSVWHTFWSVCGRRDPGLYIHGAPRNRTEAERVEAGLDPRYSNYEPVDTGERD
jgi:hypothetical protein